MWERFLKDWADVSLSSVRTLFLLKGKSLCLCLSLSAYPPVCLSVHPSICLCLLCLYYTHVCSHMLTCGCAHVWWSEEDARCLLSPIQSLPDPDVFLLAWLAGQWLPGISNVHPKALGMQVPVCVFTQLLLRWLGSCLHTSHSFYLMTPKGINFTHNHKWLDFDLRVLIAHSTLSVPKCTCPAQA